jgi:hypothetical protein
MSDFWLTIIGLSVTTGLLVYATVRLVKALRTGIYTVGGGIYRNRNDDPFHYYWRVISHIFAMILFGAIYFGLLYNKFLVDTDWMSR